MSKIAKLGLIIALLVLVAAPMTLTAAQGPQYIS